MTLDELLKKEQSLSYSECNALWEKEDTKVHEDVSDQLMSEIATHIVDRCSLTEDDIVLTVGCGDGYIDRFVEPRVKRLFSMDFSQQKLEVAKAKNPNVKYIYADFLKDYSKELMGTGINKIYSYSVMQYCKPEDVERFIGNQVNVLDRSKPCGIYHLDVPDVDKAYYYYNVRCEDVTEQRMRQERDRIKYLIGDGSCWHDMNHVRISAMTVKGVKEVIIKDAHYWKFRSDISIQIG